MSKILAFQFSQLVYEYKSLWHILSIIVFIYVIADSRPGWCATAVAELITVTNYIFSMQLSVFNFQVGGVSETP